MAVRAKFTCISITRSMGWIHRKNEAGQTEHVNGEVQTIKFQVVTDGSPESEAFFASTPFGSIEIGNTNPEVTNQFKLQQNYYVDFTPASD